jgi:PIN domain nuclease of toxin-antitoxin system
MRILLDTHVFLWLQTEPERLDAHALRAMSDARNDLLLSAASSWEIAIKYGLGKLPLPDPPAIYVPDRMRTSGIRALPVEHAHALRVAELPELHSDPFDRLLVAQAQLERAVLATADPAITDYDVETIVIA